MTLDRIWVENFGVFGKRQEVVLTPPDPSRPIVLIGGMNGDGKTTLLDALQLALYGKLARTSNRGSIGYEDYLKRCIHNSAQPESWSSIGVEFRHTSEGVEHRYVVHRSWRDNGSGVREQLEVKLDGVPDLALTDSWVEYVEDMIPVNVSQLFFFDGEKVKDLADPKNSSRMLETAVHSLLGLDLVKQLSKDLLVLEMRKRKELVGERERQQIDEIQGELDREQKVQERLQGQSEKLLAEIDDARTSLSETERRFRRAGGELFEQREQLEAERKELDRELGDHQESLRVVAGGTLPLVLLRELIGVTRAQARAEEDSKRAGVLGDVLSERDKELLAHARAQAAPSAVIRSLGAFLSADRETRRQSAEVSTYLNLSPEGNSRLSALACGAIDSVASEAVRQLNDTAMVHEQLVSLDGKLAGMPDSSSVAEVMKKREQERLQLETMESRHELLDDELRKSERTIEQVNSRLVARIEHSVLEDYEHEDAARVITHASHVREALSSFTLSVIRHHSRRIERRILECFQKLLRKSRLVTEMSIDPNEYQLELQGSGGRELTTDRFSAGERQLLAVSILWGLGQASGRALPVIIDTPLGRLDSDYRDALVTRYFPSASHQIILLSTNKEIDEEYNRDLGPSIGHRYRLIYDEEIDASTVRDGYFWD